MPAFKFEALDAAGKSSSGLLEAENAKAARSQLRAQALVPLAVTPVAAGAATQSAGIGLGRRVFDNTALAVWTRQLAGLVGAGLPLERALTALADESENPRQRELIAHLRSEVNAGSRCARAGGAPRVRRHLLRRRRRQQSGALGGAGEAGRRPGRTPALRAKLLGAMLTRRSSR